MSPLDRDDPDFDADAEEGMDDFMWERRREWDEHDLQAEYNEGRL